ncbi:MAG: type II secretion system protein [Fimbriimonas sp.]
MIRGITLLETLIVGFIVVILSAVAYAMIAPRAKASAHQVECKTNLKNLASGLNIYMGDNDGLPPPSLSLANNGKEPSCPMDRIRYMYSGNFIAMNNEGRASWVGNFDPNKHAVVKCIQHNDNTGPYELMPMTNVDGVSVMRKVPLLPEGKTLNLMSVLLDGSIRFRPLIDDYMTDLDKIAPEPR